MGPREKALWTFVMFALVLLEIRSIYLDRNAHDREQKEARDIQLSEFKKIADGIDRTLEQNQKNFAATIKPLNNTLRTATQTLAYTSPKAIGRFTATQLLPQFLPVGVGKHLRFNVYYTNDGNESGRKCIVDVRFYVGKPLSAEAEAKIWLDFNQWWPSVGHSKCLTLMPRDTAPFGSFSTADFKQEEVDGLSNGTLTLYVLKRLIYSDSAGRWRTDDCFQYQDVRSDFEVSKPCLNPDYYKSRYPDHR